MQLNRVSAYEMVCACCGRWRVETSYGPYGAYHIVKRDGQIMGYAYGTDYEVSEKIREMKR